MSYIDYSERYMKLPDKWKEVNGGRFTTWYIVLVNEVLGDKYPITMEVLEKISGKYANYCRGNRSLAEYRYNLISRICTAVGYRKVVVKNVIGGTVVPNNTQGEK